MPPPPPPPPPPAPPKPVGGAPPPPPPPPVPNASSANASPPPPPPPPPVKTEASVTSSAIPPPPPVPPVKNEVVADVDDVPDIVKVDKVDVVEDVEDVEAVVQVEERDKNEIAGKSEGDVEPVSGKSEMPVVHGAYEKNSDEEEVMVKTEFVWADGAENDVKLSGAWNGWMTIQMYHEGGGMWSVVTPVPAGTHEFKFVVDGVWRHSTRHPTVGENEEQMNNIRVIRGPPKQSGNDKKKEMQQADEDLRAPKKGCCLIE